MADAYKAKSKIPSELKGRTSAPCTAGRFSNPRHSISRLLFAKMMTLHTVKHQYLDATLGHHSSWHSHFGTLSTLYTSIILTGILQLMVPYIIVLHIELYHSAPRRDNGKGIKLENPHIALRDVFGVLWGHAGDVWIFTCVWPSGSGLFKLQSVRSDFAPNMSQTSLLTTGKQPNWHSPMYLPIGKNVRPSCMPIPHCFPAPHLKYKDTPSKKTQRDKMAHSIRNRSLLVL